MLTLLVAIWLAWRFAGLVEPELGNWAVDPQVRLWVARVVVFVFALLVGALVVVVGAHADPAHGPERSRPLARRRIRFARGVLIVGLVVIVLEFLELDQDGWWQVARFRPYAEQVAAAVRRSMRSSALATYEGGVAV